MCIKDINLSNRCHICAVAHVNKGRNLQSGDVMLDGGAQTGFDRFTTQTQAVVLVNVCLCGDLWTLIVDSCM